MVKDLVSVIIPTHKGAEESTNRCVESIKKSTYKNIEILVINEGLERSAQRNMGIDRAKGEYLLFLDSDTAVHKFTIQDCYYSIKYLKKDALYIPEIITTKGFFGKLRNWERAFYTGTCVDVVRFVKANNCPKFDINMSGPEDSDWDRRIIGERRITLYPIYHYDNISLIKYLKKKAYYAKSMEYYKKRWNKDKVLNFWYRCFFIFLEQNKWKRLLLKPHYALCLMGLIFLRGIIYICRKK